MSRAARLLDGRRMRLEWFATHDPVAELTPAAKVFTR